MLKAIPRKQFLDANCNECDWGGYEYCGITQCMSKTDETWDSLETCYTKKQIEEILKRLQRLMPQYSVAFYHVKEGLKQLEG